MSKSVGTIRHLFDDNREMLGLKWLAGEGGSNTRMISTDKIAASDLVGHLNLIYPARIQVFGYREADYYARLEQRRREHMLAEIVATPPPAILAANGLSPSPDLVAICERENIPLLGTPYDAAYTIELLRSYLSKQITQTIIKHGVFMDVLGLGVLITGESGLGKSELALELISRGHGLVADDAVELSRVSPIAVEGRCPRLLANLLEVRGLGLLDIKAIFGETAVRRKMRLKLIVHLVKRSTMENEYERLPINTLTEEVIGLPIRKVVIPVAAGRNIAVLLEAAVRNTILQLRGIDSTREFIERQHAAIHESEDGDISSV